MERGEEEGGGYEMCALDQSAEGGAFGGVSRDSRFFFFCYFSLFLFLFSVILFLFVSSFCPSCKFFLTSLIFFDKPTWKIKSNNRCHCIDSVRRYIEKVFYK